jgi:Cellulose biosynthesis protein BcsS
MRLWQGNRLGRSMSATAYSAALVSALTLLALARNTTPCAAEGAEDPQYGWREMWAGADASKDVWLLYTGVTLAPLSKDIYSDGLRLRVNSGYGQYTTTNVAPVCKYKNGNLDSCRRRKPNDPDFEYDVDVTYVEMLAGYHLRLGELTAKAFIGASMYSHEHALDDYENGISGREFGATGALEFWLNLGEHAWTSLDLNYTMAYDTGSARWRAGWRTLPTVSVGPELRFDRNEVAGSARIGVFARYEWFGGEISSAAGFARSICDPGHGKNCDGSDKDLSPYATINFLTQY